MTVSPTGIILKRSEAYNLSDPKTIYMFYAEKSEFRQWFPELKDYEVQFFELTAIYGAIHTEIMGEKIKKNLAEVTYRDRVISNEEELLFYCKGYFTKTGDGWKILKEKKEQVK